MHIQTRIVKMYRVLCIIRTKLEDVIRRIILSEKMLYQLMPDCQPLRRYEHFNVRTWL